jgi:hypothetical protein
VTTKARIGAAFASIIALALIPIPYLAAPQWSVHVVDEKGRQIEAMTVRLVWENYSVETTSHEQDLRTDRNGEVIFPSHRSSSSILRRSFYTMLSSMALAHASYGPHATVFAFDQVREGSAADGGMITDWAGKPAEMRSEIVVQPR